MTTHTNPEPPTAIDDPRQMFMDVMDKWLGIECPTDEWQTEWDDFAARLETAGYEIRLTTARPERAEIREAIRDVLSQWDESEVIDRDDLIKCLVEVVTTVIDKAGGEG